VIETASRRSWPLARQHFLLETSRPGIFAIGDVRAGNIKRFASRSVRCGLQSHSFIKCYRGTDDIQWAA
jgi:thioredoxin reductase